MILRKVSHRHFVSPGDVSSIDGKFSIRILHKAGAIADQRLQHCAFSSSVASDQCDFFAPADPRVEVLNHLDVFVRFKKTLDFQGMPTRGLKNLESNIGARDVRPGQVRSLQSLDFLFSRSDLRGARSRSEPSDKFVQLLDLLLALRVFRLYARTNLRLRENHVIVAAGVGNYGLIIDVGDMGAEL